MRCLNRPRWCAPGWNRSRRRALWNRPRALVRGWSFLGANGFCSMRWCSRAGRIIARRWWGRSIWTFIYDRANVKQPLDAFGFLVPSIERRAIMACTWVGTKWAGRVPEDKAVFRCFSTDADLSRDAAEADLVRLMNISGAPLAAVHHRWPDAMPQYTVGHSARVAELERRIAHIPGGYL